MCWQLYADIYERIILCYRANCNGGKDSTVLLEYCRGFGGFSITICTLIGCWLVVGGCDVDIICGCCLDLQNSAQGFCFPQFLQNVPLAGHTTCLVCVRNGFNRIKELGHVCAVVVLNIFHTLSCIVDTS